MTRERSQGGRRRRSARPSRIIGGISQRPFKQVRLPYRPIEVLTEDQVEAIHDTSMQILEEIGMDFLHPEARDILEKAGARVEPGAERVRFDRGLIQEARSPAPPSFTLHARNPARDLTIGANHITFATVGSAPNVSDLERGRRDGNYEDFRDLVRLASGPGSRRRQPRRQPRRTLRAVPGAFHRQPGTRCAIGRGHPALRNLQPRAGARAGPGRRSSCGRGDRTIRLESLGSRRRCSRSGA